MLKSVLRVVTITIVLLALVSCSPAKTKFTKVKMAKQCRGEKYNLVFISGANEYFSNQNLCAYKEWLEKTYPKISVTVCHAAKVLDKTNVQGLQALENADLMLIFARRLTIDGQQLQYVKDYIKTGRPVVGIRNASHGLQNFLEFDKLVLGGTYHGTTTGKPDGREVGPDGRMRVTGPPVGPVQTVNVIETQKDHPVLEGVTDFTSKYTLYRTTPLADDVTALMTGSIPGEEVEPTCWVRTVGSQRVFYTSLGGKQDWDNPTYVRLVTNGIFWALGCK
jgi:type 1 glutamine amidotransferase